MFSKYITAFLIVALCFFNAVVSTADTKEEAKSAFKEGIKRFNNGDYEEAVVAFRRAYDLRPTWTLFFNIGQSEAASKRYGLAYEAFESYISLGGDELPVDRRDEVVKELDRLLKLVGSVEISAPAGCVVYFNSIERGTLPLPGRLKAAVGVVHDVDIHLDGKSIHNRRVKLSRGEILRIEVNPTPESGDDASAPIVDGPEESEAQPSVTEREAVDDEEDDVAPSRMPKREIAGWSLVGTGGAILIGAAVTGGIALSLNNELADECGSETSCPPALEDKGLRRQLLAVTTDVLIGVGACAAAIGTGLVIWSRKTDKRESAEAPISIAPVLHRTGAAIGIGGRF